MNTGFHEVDHSFFKLRAALIFGVAVFAFLGGNATTSVAEDMMHGDRGGDHRGMGPGLGIGTGIGIGIGIGEGLSQQPATAPATNPVSKKKPTDQPPPLKFVGKPDNVAFNPQQKDGKLGDLNDHKQITVAKDSSYFIRHYYYTRDGKQLSWYYYDVPASPTDTATAQHQDVPNCLLNDDNCDGPPQRPLYVDNNTPTPDAGTTDGGVKIIEDAKDCPGGVIRVSVASTTCVAGFVHNIDDHYNYCPPDTTNYHHSHTDTPTKTPCGPGTNPGPGTAWTPPGVPDARDGCASPVEVRTEEHAEDVGGIWEITIYPIYKCNDGKEYYGIPQTVEDGRVADGGPKPPLDADKLAPKGK
jgi:hypothetical protein